MTARQSARNAYVDAEVVTALAHQIRAIRLQRGWSQHELARKLGTTQGAVSRLEDPSYGKASLQTLLQLAHVFDAGLQVRFVSLVRMLQKTFVPQPQQDAVPSFEEEAAHVGFVDPAPRRTTAHSESFLVWNFPVNLVQLTPTSPTSPTSIAAKAKELTAA